ncbi:sugar transferase [Marinomonas sp. C2222]|uniref:Sugar transferase n=1 Tax=Marinomonas sargassi TaxID=2984494 RepID=A0ABT2YP23_9GAMM|nr:sugar transferase [Marinomonas sargassi]MCV2401632.1 sugar transferase [Marinomonas sargassi]
MQKNIPRYQSRRVLWAYRIVDLCLPLVTLLCWQFILGDQPWKTIYAWLGTCAGVLLLLSTMALRGYSRSLERSIAKKLEVTFKAWASSILAISFFAYLNGTVFIYNQAVIIIWGVITPMAVFLFKFFINRKSRSASRGSTDVLVLGNGYAFNKFELAQLKRHNIQLRTIVDYDVLAVKSAVASKPPDFIVMNLDKVAEPDLIKALTHLDLQGAHLLALHHFMESFLRKCYIPYESTELAYLDRICSYSRINFLLKRLLDISASVIIALLTSPVMLYAVLKIRRESPGPVIFSQKRVGLSGQEHTIYKFRSMHLDAEKNGAQFAKADDPRAYAFGAFMRKTRIDELPQLWNVIIGDLHFVGPRPERKVFTDQLEEEIPYYNERHLVSPGITGWAQVLYPYGANTEDSRQKLMYDLYYIKHWSIWLEIETIIRTAFVVLGRKGI